VKNDRKTEVSARSVQLSNDNESLTALRAEAEDRKAVIQGCSALYAQAAHYRKTRPHTRLMYRQIGSCSAAF